MLVYSSIKDNFMMDVEEGTLVDKIIEEIFSKMNRKTPKSEIRSWQNSLQYMFMVLSDDSIPQDAGVAIEYNIPNTSKRVDFIITGESNNGDKNAVVIELKQWESIEKVDSLDAIVRTYLGGGIRDVAHPSYQAWSYATLIEDFNEAVQNDDINLAPCAYLHNYNKIKNDPLTDSVYQHYIEKAPVFVKGDVRKLRDFIKKFIHIGNSDILYEIDNGRLKPSKSLQDSIKNMIDGKEEFIMIDEQKVVYERILEATRSKDDKKRVIIVEGGPGTGKTVLAVNLLSKLLNEDKTTFYVSKNSAPRDVFAKKLTEGQYKKAHINNLFKGSGAFMEVDTDTFDCLIVDEAHRLNEKSGLFYKGDNQIKEIMNAAKTSIFFIDDRQKVHIKDIGSVSEIRKWANRLNIEIIEDKLVSQFRCNGSDGYLAWLDHTLDIEDTAHYIFDFDYDFRIIDSPNELYNLIEEKNHNNKARMLAGYCWNWEKDKRDNTNHFDISIDKHNFGMSWNLGNTQTWAIDKESVNEIGCIHTSQGLEFEYVGVIIGDDLRYENGEIITDFTKRAQTDRSLFGIKKMYKENPEKALKLSDEIIKNTYRTLMTRGSKGCYIYCTDKNLQNYFKKQFIDK